MASEINDYLKALKVEKDKLVPEIIKANETVFGVTGNFVGGDINGVKLFENETAMQNDTTAKPGDLAVVYKNTLHNWDGKENVTYFYFSDVITLDTTISSSTRISQYMNGTSTNPNTQRTNISADIYLSRTQFSIYCMEELSNMIDVTYNSSDGKHYFRESKNNYYKSEYKWTYPTKTTINSSVAQFMQTGEVNFKSLYEYKESYNYNQPYFINKSSTTNLKYPNFTNTWFNIPTKDDYEYMAIIATNTSDNKLVDYTIYKSNNEISLQQVTYGSSSTPIKIFLGYSPNSNMIEDTLVKEIYENSVLKSSQTFSYKDFQKIWGSYDYDRCILELNNTHFVYTSTNKIMEWHEETPPSFVIITPGEFPLYGSLSGAGYKISFQYNLSNSYSMVPNQFNLYSQDELLPQITALGNKDVITGNEGVYKNLDNYLIYKYSLGVDPNDLYLYSDYLWFDPTKNFYICNREIDYKYSLCEIKSVKEVENKITQQVPEMLDLYLYDSHIITGAKLWVFIKFNADNTKILVFKDNELKVEKVLNYAISTKTETFGIYEDANNICIRICKSATETLLLRITENSVIDKVINYVSTSYSNRYITRLVVYNDISDIWYIIETNSSTKQTTIYSCDSSSSTPTNIKTFTLSSGSSVLNYTYRDNFIYFCDANNIYKIFKTNDKIKIVTNGSGLYTNSDVTYYASGKKIYKLVPIDYEIPEEELQYYEDSDYDYTEYGEYLFDLTGTVTTSRGYLDESVKTYIGGSTNSLYSPVAVRSSIMKENYGLTFFNYNYNHIQSKAYLTSGALNNIKNNKFCQYLAGIPNTDPSRFMIYKCNVFFDKYIDESNGIPTIPYNNDLRVGVQANSIENSN